MRNPVFYSSTLLSALIPSLSSLSLSVSLSVSSLFTANSHCRRSRSTPTRRLSLGLFSFFSPLPPSIFSLSLPLPPSLSPSLTLLPSFLCSSYSIVNTLPSYSRLLLVLIGTYSPPPFPYSDVPPQADTYSSPNPSTPSNLHASHVAGLGLSLFPCVILVLSNRLRSLASFVSITHSFSTPPSPAPTTLHLGQQNHYHHH